MTIDLGAARPSMYCTWIDVIGLVVVQASTGQSDFSAQEIFSKVRTISQIEGFISQASALVTSKLNILNMSLLAANPWSTIPLERGKEGGSPANIGDGSLLGIQVNEACDVCAVWRTEIATKGNLSTARYDLYSYVEGVQGSNLSMGNDNESSNGDVTIGSNSFLYGSRNWESYDSYYFSTILARQEIWMVTLTLAGAYLLNSVYTEESPNESKYGNILWSRGMSYLKDLQNGKSELSGMTVDMSPIQIPYEISVWGRDLTKYQTNLADSYR